MARFQGNVHAGSDKVGATMLVFVLLVIIGLVAWTYLDPTGSHIFWSNITGNASSK